jgi:hypothetical protein
MRPLSSQSATEAITKNIQTFIITKTKQVVKVHQCSIPPYWVGGISKRSKTTTKNAAASFLLSLRTFSPNKRGICSHEEAEAEAE